MVVIGPVSSPSSPLISRTVQSDGHFGFPLVLVRMKHQDFVKINTMSLDSSITVAGDKKKLNHSVGKLKFSDQMMVHNHWIVVIGHQNGDSSSISGSNTDRHQIEIRINLQDCGVLSPKTGSFSNQVDKNRILGQYLVYQCHLLWFDQVKGSCSLDKGDKTCQSCKDNKEAHA